MRIIGGKYRGKKIVPPSHKSTRPTSDRTRETMFNILLHNPAFGSKVLKDKAVLDVFAGTGALGLEAFSRGAKSVVFIENDKDTLAILYTNTDAFGLSSSSILEQDATQLRMALSVPFNLIFLDPPYGKNLILPVLTHLYTQGWLSQDTVVVIEMAKNESLILPSYLELVTERISGSAKVLFCFTHAS